MPRLWVFVGLQLAFLTRVTSDCVAPNLVINGDAEDGYVILLHLLIQHVLDFNHSRLRLCTCDTSSTGDAFTECLPSPWVQMTEFDFPSYFCGASDGFGKINSGAGGSANWFWGGDSARLGRLDAHAWQVIDNIQSHGTLTFDIHFYYATYSCCSFVNHDDDVRVRVLDEDDQGTVFYDSGQIRGTYQS